MKDQLELFVNMLYSNAAILKVTHTKIFFTLILLLINIALISVPNYIGVVRGGDNVMTIENIEVAFSAMYDDQLNCAVDETQQMQCVEPFQTHYGDYAFLWTESIDIDAIDVSTIAFSPTYAAIVHVANPGEENETLTVVSGNYDLLKGFDFSTVSDKADDVGERAMYYQESTALFLRDLYFSQINLYMVLIYMTQGAQLILYAMFVSVFFLLLNYRAKMKKITFSASFKITVFAMTGPALLTASIGLLNPLWAGMVFMFVYLARIIVIYYRVNKVEETLA